MENISPTGNKCFQEDLSTLDMTENNEVLPANLKEGSSKSEENKCLENISANSSVKFLAPSEYLVSKIIQQVESLFSDSHVLKDKFLLKHMRRNKEGYVSLKLISSLRKVKALSKDWRVVAYSLQKSEKLQMNSEMTKIRRIDPLPLPEVLDASRTALVFSYLVDYCTFQNMQKQLRKLGTVESLVIVKSKADVMNANVKKTLASHEKIVSFPFAVVTFATTNELTNVIYQTFHPASLLKMVPLIEDENEVSKLAVLSPNEEKECSIKSKESTVSFNEGKISPDQNQFNYKGKPLLNFPPKGDGPENNRWSPRKIRIAKDKMEIQKPFVIILRPPKGPDGTKGFRMRKPSLSSVLIAHP